MDDEVEILDRDKCPSDDSQLVNDQEAVEAEDEFDFTKLKDWYKLSAVNQNNHKDFLEENFEPKELKFAYEDYFAKHGKLPETREFRVFTLKSQGRRRRKKNLVEMDQKVQKLEGENTNLNMNQLIFSRNINDANSLCSNQQEQLQKLIADHLNLQAKMAQVMQIAQHLQENNESILANNTQLQTDCLRLDTENHTKDYLVQQLYGERDRKDNTIKAKEKTITDLAMQNTEKEKTITDVTTQNTELTTQNTENKKTITDLTTQNTENKKSITDLTTQNTDLTTQNTENKKTITDLTTQNTENKKSITDLTTQNTDLTTQNTENKKTITDLTTQNTELTTQNTEKEKTITDITTQNTENKKTITDLTTQNTELTTQNTELTTQNTELTTQNTENKKTITDLTTKNTDLKHVNIALRNRLEKTLEICDEKDRKLRKQHIKIDEIQNELTSTNERLENLEKRQEKKNDEMERLKSDNVKQSEHIKSQDETITDLRLKLESQDQINTQLFLQMEELKMMMNQRQQ